MANHDSEAPWQRRRTIHIELTRARQAAGLSREQAAASLVWSLSKLIRAEFLGNCSTTDLKEMLSLYGITDPDKQAELVSNVRLAREEWQPGLYTASDMQLWQELSGEDFENAIEAQLGPANLSRPPLSTAHSGKDPARFGSNESFWKKILDEEIRANAPVILEDFFLFEWFPRSPGLFHTKRGHDARVDAQRQQRWQFQGDPNNNWKYNAIVKRTGGVGWDDPPLNLAGKTKMLEGGYGCIRLLPKPTELGTLWFMSASSTLSPHEGVPLALNDHMYRACIDHIVEDGALGCSIFGTLKFLPKPLLSLYQDYVEVPSLYLLVEEVQPIYASLPIVPLVSVAVLFESDVSPRCSAAYVSFAPAVKGEKEKRLEWLEGYVSSY